ncbi:MAG: SPOR domain-containing protein [Bacteroidaceae bacterium]
MKSYLVLGLGMCVAFSVTSCKSNESAYKKAYEKALQQENKTAQVKSDTAVEVVPVENVAPSVPVTPVKDDYSNEKVRQEKLQLINGAGLKDFSVVCGSFGLKANAEGVQATLKGKGYSAQIAYNSALSMYRVIATTFSDKASAVQSRDELRATYPDAWLLYNK